MNPRRALAVGADAVVVGGAVVVPMSMTPSPNRLQRLRLP
jgi:putative N-acetylmannosamine-6-phosphate epimerase